MEIVPNGKIYLLQNVPLNNTYENTIYWGAGQETAQANYFMSKCTNQSVFSFSESNYQRIGSGVLSIRGVAEQIMNCNYLMFRNSLKVEDYPSEGQTAVTDFPWVYAFITDVEYCSTFKCNIHYEIDVLQTFHFRYTLGQCLVEREHNATDAVGDNIVDEDLPCGDYHLEELYERIDGEPDALAFSNLKETYIMLAATFDGNYQDTYGASIAGTFSGLYFIGFDNTVQGRVNCANFINGAPKPEGIVAIFLMPKIYALQLNVGSVPTSTHNIPASTLISGGIDGQAVKNNKLYTYPYNYIQLYNNQGNVADLRIEKFYSVGITGYLTFEQWCDFSCSPVVNVLPKYYDGLVSNYMETLTLGPYPQCAWVTDTFKAWLAQNSTSYLISSIGSSISGVMSAVGGNAVGGIKTLLGEATSQLMTIEKAKRLPDQSHGNINSSQGLCARNEFYMRCYRKYLRHDYVKIIDNYFTMFGYKQMIIKTPSRNVRPHFTYTKTINCIIQSSNVPTVYLDKIISIFNSGVRYWNYPAEIGDYSVNNAPV